MSEELVTITLEEYERLKEADKVLDTLYAWGVDNWEWYEESLQSVHSPEEE